MTYDRAVATHHRRDRRTRAGAQLPRARRRRRRSPPASCRWSSRTPTATASPTSRRVLRAAGAERFAVATVAEGVELRAAGAIEPIVVLGGVYRAEHERVVDDRLTAVVWEPATAAELGAVARSRGRTAPVHVKVDTGMSRLGVAPESAIELIRRLHGTAGVAVEGLLTHFCSAERVGGPETARQLATLPRARPRARGGAAAAGGRARGEQRGDARGAGRALRLGPSRPGALRRAPVGRDARPCGARTGHAVRHPDRGAA